MSDPCNSCQNNCSPSTYYYQSVPCVTSASQCSTWDSSKVVYTGANLIAVGIEANDTVEEAFAAINTAVGAISGADWSSYDYNCIDDSSPITTAQEFAEAISLYTCTLNTTVDTFISSTYAGDKSTIEASILAIEEPNLTSCVSVGVVPTDTYSQVLTKILDNLCDVNDAIDPSGADWNSCFTVSPSPTTIQDAFDTVISQICNIKSTLDGLETIPTFDNTGTCLSTPTSTDSLYDTVVKIRDYACDLPTFDIDDLTWTSCISNPNPSGGADLKSTIDAIIQYLDASYINRVVNWDSTYFDVDYNTPADACSGISVTLQSGLGFEDKLVALNVSDGSPGYLLSKMTAGTGMNFDTSTTPGTVIIESTITNDKVKADSGDTAAGYLIDKIAGKSDATAAISLAEAYNATDDKVEITPTIDYAVLAEEVLNAIDADTATIRALFNALVCEAQPCPDGEERMIAFHVETMAGSSTTEFNIVATQANPVLALFNSGDVTGTAGDEINTGYYTVTSASLPTTGTLTITNNDGGAELPYNIYVLDDSASSVTGATVQSGSIAAGSFLTIDPFSYGSTTKMIVYIELGDILTTTTTSTTTTTTTTAP